MSSYSTYNRRSNRLYLVEQDYASLFGTYLVSAVVAAPTADDAKELIVGWCRCKGPGDAVVVRRDRLTTRLLRAGSPTWARDVLCVQVGVDCDEPQSWSDADVVIGDDDD